MLSNVNVIEEVDPPCYATECLACFKKYFIHNRKMHFIITIVLFFCSIFCNNMVSLFLSDSNKYMLNNLQSICISGKTSLYLRSVCFEPEGRILGRRETPVQDSLSEPHFRIPSRF